MTPHEKAKVTKALARVKRCRGCGGWRFQYADHRPCVTCVVLGKRREITRLLGVDA